MLVIRFSEVGGPEVMHSSQAEVGAPAVGEALVRHTAIGLNFIDTYHRSGLYPVPLPSGLGLEAAGVVEAVGAGVTEVRPGNRVAYGTGPLGAYAEARCVPVRHLVPLPPEISDETAAAIMLKGMTAQYLVRRTYQVKAGDTILVHAAAGGVGLLLCQWAAALGARVIGTVGSDAKVDLAREHGCAEVIVTCRESFPSRLRELTGGEGVPVVYDAVGATTWEGSLDCLRPRGLMVSYGNASGPVPPFAPTLLAQKGSLYLTRPSLTAYTSTREELLETAAELFEVVRSGAVRVEVHQRYPLAEVVRAHRELGARRTTGSSLLIP
jgi:NADPH:quinone reductase